MIRNILAFLISPFLGIASLILIVSWSVLIGAADKNQTIFIEGFNSALFLMMPVYFIMVVLSVPIFTIIKYMLGWQLWSCIISAMLTVVALVFLFFMGFDSEEIENFLNNRFIVGSFIGVILYGVAFWFVVKDYGKNKIK